MLPKRTKTGVLLINLGTPDGTSYWPMRRYLKEFLWDKRVVEFPRPLWWLVLNGIILTFRPKKSGAAYEKIWNRERGESPLRTITRATMEQVAAQFADQDHIRVEWAMRYGTPSIPEKIQALLDMGCDKILLFPLYPQYSGSTTATANDKAFDYLATMRWQPAIRTVAPYYSHPAHIEALATSLKDSLKALPFEPEIILASFHGIPKAYCEKGDPYEQHCNETLELLREAMGMDADKLRLTFQSRLGRTPWLAPYTDQTLEKLGQQGIKKIAVITPGFAADCVETLEEINMEGRDIFMENGGEEFAIIPCLNDSKTSVDMLKLLVKENLAGWR